jgi:phosphotransferase system enzyme I (PtsI)
LRYIPLLLGMGLRELSMQPGFLLGVKRLIRECDAGELTRRLDAVMDDLEREDLPEVLAGLGTGA